MQHFPLVEAPAEVKGSKKSDVVYYLNKRKLSHHVSSKVETWVKAKT